MPTVPTPRMPAPPLWVHAGNADLFTAAWISADALVRGSPLHLHAEGPRGTGKTTVLRAFARALPPITRIRGCPYNCDPNAPHCPLHVPLSADEIRTIGSERVPMPFLELSASAKLGTAVGTIDLERLLDPGRPQAALLPGTIARAHRGILFVDEVNRLADVAPELADALLDVMGTKPGRLQIEEAGLPPVVIPTTLAVWAASNPDEDPGPLEHTRLQLADRFDLRVAVEPPREPAVVLAILHAHAHGLAAPTAGGSSGGPPPAEVFGPPLGEGPAGPSWPEGLLRFMADTYLRIGLRSIRALLAWQRAAEGAARRAGHGHVRAEDVRLAARLALRGRVDPEVVETALRGLEAADGMTRSVSTHGTGGAGGMPAAVAAGPEGGAPDGAGPNGRGETGPAAPSPAVRPARPISEVRPLVRPEWTGPSPGGEGQDGATAGGVRP